MIVRHEVQFIDPRAASCLSSPLSGDDVACSYTNNYLLVVGAYNADNLEKLKQLLPEGVQKSMMGAFAKFII